MPAGHTRDALKLQQSFATLGAASTPECEMPGDERSAAIAAIEAVEALRNGRTLVCFFNFDRQADQAALGLTTLFHQEVKEALYRILKETGAKDGVDLCLYTRGGDTNSVWPIVSLLREFDKDFEVLVPFRCHSSGTLAALGANRIVLAPLAELSPIDPSTGNQFNPRDAGSGQPLQISVEDVRAYRDFVLDHLGLTDTKGAVAIPLQPFLQLLSTNVHPLALGNVHRVLKLIEHLAVKLLDLHPVKGEDKSKIISALTSGFFSHLHMINREEAQSILGSRVEYASTELAAALDRLLRYYEDAYELRNAFFGLGYLGAQQEVEARFIGGVAESRAWSYLFETKATIRQATKLPPNVQVQIPYGQPMPLVPGLPREVQVAVKEQGWVHNVPRAGATP